MKKITASTQAFFVTISISITLVLAGVTKVSAQSTSWKGTSNSYWSTASNWTAGVPTSSTNVVIGDGSFTGNYQPQIRSTSACKSITIGGTRTSTLTLYSNLNVSSNVNISANGTVRQNSSTINVTGNWNNAGAYSASSSGSKVNMTGAASSINGPAGTTFRNLTIAAGGTTLLKTNVTVSGFLSKLTVNGTLNPNENPTYTVSGMSSGINVGAAGILKVNAATFAGNYLPSGGSTTLTSGSVVDYSSTTVNQTILNTLTYSTLKISGTTIKTLAGNLNALNSSASTRGNIYVTSGTLDLSTFTANRGTSTAGGTLSVSNGAFLKIKGVNTYPANFATNTFNLTSTVEYYGDNQTVSAQTYGNLIFSGLSGAVVKTLPAAAFTIGGNFTSNKNTAASVNYTAASNLTVSGNVNIGASTTFNGGAFSHVITGNIVNNGILTGSTSTINLNGSAAAMSGSGQYSYNDLVVSASNNTIASGTNVTVNGNFSTSGSGSITHISGGTFTMAGTGKTISGTGIVLDNLACSGTITTTSNLALTGNLSVNGSLTASAGNINMSGTGKSISGAGTISFNALTTSGTISASTGFSITSSLDVSGSFTASAGTATFKGSSTLNGTANLYNVTLNGTSLQLSTNAVLGIGNIFTRTAGTLNVTSNLPNTVTYNGTVAQNVLGGTYHHLVLANGNIKTAIGSVTVNGDVSILPSTTFVSGSFTHNLAGNWLNSGTFTAGTGTINFSGSANTTISGATTFNVLTVNKTSTVNQVTLLNNVSVPTVNMTNGSLITGANTITITNTRTGNGIILGNIQRTHAFAAGVAYDFEGPHNSITFSSVTGVGTVTVKVAKGAIGDFPFSGSISRVYDIVVPSGTYSATLKLHYEDEELNGNNESAMQLWKYNSSAWATAGKTGSNAVNNFVEQTGLTALNTRWTVSDDANVVKWTGAISSDWSNTGNWSVVQGSPSFPPSANDIVEIGVATFNNQPVISTSATAKSLVFGSVKPVNLSLTTGGSLLLNGNISGSWAANATHTININNQTLTVKGNAVLSNGVNGQAINVNLATGTFTVLGSLFQSGAANIVSTGASFINFGKDFSYTNGVFTAGTGTVTYTGTGSQEVAGVTYNHLIINKTSGIGTLQTASSVMGNFTLTMGQLDLNGGLTVYGNSTINSGSSLQNNGIAINIRGNWNNSGNYIPHNGGIVFNGVGAQSISATTFNNFTIDKPSGIATLAGNVTVNGNMSITGGTLDIAGFSCNRSLAGGSCTLSANAVLKVGGSNNFPANFSSYLFHANSTTEYNGSTAQSVAGITYGSLLFTNGGSNQKTLMASTVINGDITINSGANFDAGSYTIELFGNWINNGTFVPGTSVMLFEGINKTINGNTSFYKSAIYGSYVVTGSDITYNSNLRVLPGASYDGGSGVATLNGDLTNNGSLISTGITNFSGNVVQTIRFVNALVSNSSGVINFNGTVPPVLNSTSTPTYATLNVNNTGGVNASVDWNVMVAFNINSGATFNGGNSTHNVYGTFTNNGTVTSTGIINFTPATPKNYLLGSNFNSTGRVVFGGTGAISATGTPILTDVTISNTTGVTPLAGWNMMGDFTITGDGIFNATNNNFTVNGDIESGGILNGGTSTFLVTSPAGEITGSTTTTFYHLNIAGGVTASVNEDFNVEGNLTTAGTLDASAASVVFTGAGNSTIGGAATPLSKFKVEKAANAVVTLARDVTEAQTIDVVSGTLDAATFNISQDGTAGAENSLFIHDSATLKIGGTNSLPVFTAYTFDSLSTVEYAGTTQTVSTISAFSPYGNLTISNSGVKTANGSLNIRNNFTLTGGSFVTGAHTDTLGGNWTMAAGSFTSTGSTFTLNGTALQTITSSGAFNNMIINKEEEDVLLGSNMAVNGTLTFSKGHIITLGNKVIVNNGGSVAAAASTTGWVIGNLQKYLTTGSNITRTFEFGDSASYTPATVTVASITSAGTLTAAVASADHPAVAFAGLSGSKSVNRNWTLSNSGVVFTTAAVTFNWLAAHLDAGVVTANLKVAKLNNTWSLPAVANITATSIQATGLTSFGEFAIGEMSSALLWTGAANSDWNNTANWQNGVSPTNRPEIVIPSGLTNYPVISSGTVEVNDVNLQSTSSITVDNSIFKIKGAMTTVGGSIVALNGKIELAGTVQQTVPAGIFASNLVKDLVISNTAGVTLGGAVRIAGVLSFGNVNNATLTTAGFLTFASTAIYTASLADITNGNINSGNSIVGAVTVERHMPGKRAFRFLTVPLSSTGSIKANWMENTNNPATDVNLNPVPNYGIHITGAGGSSNGFDQTLNNNFSLFTFNNVSQTWSPVTNSATNFIPGNGYRVFVRGSRSTDLSDNYATPSPTVVRASGSLITGTVAMRKSGSGTTAGVPDLTTSLMGYSLIGNPYVSAVDWNAVERSDISSTFYVFDPTLNGSTGRGAYVAYNGSTGVINNDASNIDNNLQQGQAFFVQTRGANPSLTFKENHKTSVRRSVFRPSNLPRLSIKLLLSNEGNVQNAADGLTAYFSPDFDATIGDEDSYKMTNLDENIGIKRDGKVLSIEGRKPVSLNDTLPLEMWQLSQKSYTLKFTTANFESNTEAFLEDAFLHTSTQLTNKSETKVSFDITSDPASVSRDRFRVVFKKLATLPVELTGVKAYEKNKGVQVEWTTASEINVEKYEIEKSANAQQFVATGTITSKGNSNGAAYGWFDENPANGINYYRIKSIDYSGQTKYSPVVKVQVAKNAGITVGSSAISGNSINLVFKNIEKGIYMVNLTNTAGQKVYTASINHAGGSATQVVKVNTQLAAGIYHLQTFCNSKPVTIPIIVQ